MSIGCVDVSVARKERCVPTVLHHQMLEVVVAINEIKTVKPIEYTVSRETRNPACIEYGQAYWYDAHRKDSRTTVDEALRYVKRGKMTIWHFVIGHWLTAIVMI